MACISNISSATNCDRDNTDIGNVRSKLYLRQTLNEVSCYIVAHPDRLKLMKERTMTFARRRSPLQRLSFALITLLLGACATQADMMRDLDNTLRGYEKAVRWAQFDAVYSFHRWEDGQQPSIPARMESIKVTKYETSREKFDPKAKIMKQTVTVHYYNTDDQRVRTLKYPQEWKYFPKFKRWYLISDPIVFP
jgi:hypothetical protein